MHLFNEEIVYVLGYVANNLSCLKNALWLDIGRLSMGIGAGLHCYVVRICIQSCPFLF